MLEAAALIATDGSTIHFHTPEGRSTVHIPDTQELWDVIWRHRQDLLGVAHTHPGSGNTSPSFEDVTTFSATELALGRRLWWWIATSDVLTVWRFYGGKGKYDYRGKVIQAAWSYRYTENDSAGTLTRDEDQGIKSLSWIDELRRRSGYYGEENA